MQANYVQRLRIVFGKAGPARFISHLDLARALERALNRAQIPLAYTQGYNKRPRMQLAAALPLGFTSDCEIADIWLVDRVNLATAQSTMEAKMAPGITIQDLSEVELSAPALQTVTATCTYIVTLADKVDGETLQARIDTLMASESVERARRGKLYDLRPLILDLALTKAGDQSLSDILDPLHLTMRLFLMQGKTGRPDEVLRALELDPLSARIHRTEITMLDDKDSSDS